MVEGPLNLKHALVTGGNRGIGRAIAQILHANGARVSILSRTAPADPGDSFHVGADVADESSVECAFHAVRERFGPIAILVNNAGIAESAPVKRTTRAMWDRIIATNLTGTYLCSRLALPAMLEQGYGRIVNVASIAGLFGAPYISAYAASKHGVMGFTRSASAELEGTGVTMNAICPGYTETEMMERAIDNIVKRTAVNAREARAQLARTNPGGRIVTADEVAQSALELVLSTENGREIVLPPLPGGGA